MKLGNLTTHSSLSKLNHTQLLSKEDGSDGTCIKIQVYILSNDVHFVVRPHIHPKLEI